MPTSMSMPTSMPTSSALIAAQSEKDKSECDHWGKFYTSHASARVYQPRRYIYTEFLEYFRRGTSSENKKTSADAVDNVSLTLSSATSDVSFFSLDLCIFEVGCAHGCTIFPLLEKFHPSTKFIATDFCPQALEIFKNNALFDEARISLYELDLCCPDAELMSSFSSRADFLLATFVLSAINPIHYVNCFRNMNRICKIGSYLLFRDYAFHDLTMYRHKKRYDERLFRRADNTYAFYFTKEDIEQFASTSGFIVEEMYYATVLNKNRRSNLSMKRVFLHAVLKKIADL
jgi:SAM-dependent methyltransferase